MARRLAVAHGQDTVGVGFELIGGRGRGQSADGRGRAGGGGRSGGGRGRATGGRGRAIGRGGSDAGRAPVSYPAVGAQPIATRAGAAGRVPATGGRAAVPRPSGRGVPGPVPARAADPGRAASAGCASVPGVARRYVRQPAGSPSRGRIYDGWFPLLGLTVTAVNRKKWKMTVEFRRARYEEHVVDGPLPKLGMVSWSIGDWGRSQQTEKNGKRRLNCAVLDVKRLLLKDLCRRIGRFFLPGLLNPLKLAMQIGRTMALRISCVSTVVPPPAMHRVEFQKRGLPHAHILVWRKGSNGEIGVENINTLISAEIPDALLDPLGYALVYEFMMHGPCGEMNNNRVCMKNGVCLKYFPKDFRDTTVVDDNGFVLYRRRDDGRRIYKNGHYLDNRHVVPYNMAMLKKFQGHINVEWCNKTQDMKYLFKYVTKGADYSKVMLERLKKLNKSGCCIIDEVQEYLICRYICEYDALWRIFGFGIHFKMPSVQRLTVHMPGMNIVYYRNGDVLTKIVDSDFLQKTILTEWFVANEMFEQARSST